MFLAGPALAAHLSPDNLNNNAKGMLHAIGYHRILCQSIGVAVGVFLEREKHQKSTSTPTNGKVGIVGKVFLRRIDLAHLIEANV